MAKGRRTCELPDLGHIRDYAARELQALPSALRKLECNCGGIQVEVSDAVHALAARVDAAIR